MPTSVPVLITILESQGVPSAEGRREGRKGMLSLLQIAPAVSDCVSINVSVFMMSIYPHG